MYGFNPHAPIDLLPLPTTERTNNDAREHAEFIRKLHETTKANIERMNKSIELLVVKVEKKLNLNRVILFGYI